MNEHPKSVRIMPPDMPMNSDTPTVVQSSRRFMRGNHQVEIRATYQVLVDGRAYELHFSVGSDGKVSTHLLPYQIFSSLVDMVAEVIQKFPESFSADQGDDHA